MSVQLNAIKTGAIVKSACAAALPHEQINNPMHTTPSKKKIKYSFDGSADVMKTKAKSKIEQFIVKKAGRRNAERAQEEGQIQMTKAILEMLPLGNSAASNGIKTEFVRFLIMIRNAFSRGAVDEAVLKCLKQC